MTNLVMETTAIATADWTPMYSDPIDVRAGETVVVGHDDPEWPGWLWCTDPRGKSGWTPAAIIDSGVVSENFTARELRIRAGDSVALLRHESGWYWARDGEGREGWIPATSVRAT